MHAPAIVCKNFCQGACQSSGCLFIIPAFQFAANFNIHHCHREFFQKRRVTHIMMHTGPMRCLGYSTEIVQPQFLSVLLYRKHKITHIPRSCRTIFTGIDISKGMYRQHLFQRMRTLMPCHHAGDIKIREMFVHLRQEFFVMQADRLMCRHKVKLIARRICMFHNFLPVKRKSRLFRKKAFFLQNVPDMAGHISKIPVCVDEIYRFFSAHVLPS